MTAKARFSTVPFCRDKNINPIVFSLINKYILKIKYEYSDKFTPTSL